MWILAQHLAPENAPNFPAELRPPEVPGSARGGPFCVPWPNPAGNFGPVLGSTERAGLRKRSGPKRPGLAKRATAPRRWAWAGVIGFLQDQASQTAAAVCRRTVGPEQLGGGLDQFNLRRVLRFVHPQKGQDVVVGYRSLHQSSNPAMGRANWPNGVEIHPEGYKRTVGICLAVSLQLTEGRALNVAQTAPAKQGAEKRA